MSKTPIAVLGIDLSNYAAIMIMRCWRSRLMD